MWVTEYCNVYNGCCLKTLRTKRSITVSEMCGQQREFWNEKTEEKGLQMFL